MVKILQFIFDLQLPITCNPWTTLSNPCNKVRGKILLKKSSCVFLPASLSLSCLRLINSLRQYVSSIYMYISAWTCIWECNTSSDIWFILFNVLTLNVAICIVLLHLSNFCLCLSSAADFSNNEARAPTSAERAFFFFTRAKSDAVWTYDFSHGNLSMAVFSYLINIRYL